MEVGQTCHSPSQTWSQSFPSDVRIHDFHECEVLMYSGKLIVCVALYSAYFVIPNCKRIIMRLMSCFFMMAFVAVVMVDCGMDSFML